MKCKDAHALFSEYIDGTLPQERVDKLEEHLSACAECRNELDAWKQAEAAFLSVLDTEAVPVVSLEEFVTKSTVADTHKSGMFAIFAQWLSAPRRRVAATVAGSVALTALLVMLVSAGTLQPNTPDEIKCDQSLSPRRYIALGRIDYLTERGFHNDF